MDGVTVSVLSGLHGCLDGMGLLRNFAGPIPNYTRGSITSVIASLSQVSYSVARPFTKERPGLLSRSRRKQDAQADSRAQSDQETARLPIHYFSLGE